MSPVIRVYCDRHHDRVELHQLWLADLEYRLSAHDDLMAHLRDSGIDVGDFELPTLDRASASLGGSTPIGDHYVHSDERTGTYLLWCPEDPKRHQVELRGSTLTDIVTVLLAQGEKEISLHGLRLLVHRMPNR